MKVEPAAIEQVRQASDGRMVLVSSEVSTVAADLKRIHPNLNVYFAEAGNPPYWQVEYETPDGSERYPVLTQKAYENSFGVWEGLHPGIVERVQYVDQHGRGRFVLADELDKARKAREKQNRDAFHERIGDAGERAFHELRKAAGATDKAFISRKVGK